MKISPISSTLSKPNFKGQFAYNYNESTLKNNKLWQKNSSVEQTLGAYHVNKTSQAYFADPMEPISDAIKEKVDYVVYDNEPAYPEIDEVSKNYSEHKEKITVMILKKLDNITTEEKWEVLQIRQMQNTSSGRQQNVHACTIMQAI